MIISFYHINALLFFPQTFFFVLYDILFHLRLVLFCSRQCFAMMPLRFIILLIRSVNSKRLNSSIARESDEEVLLSFCFVSGIMFIYGHYRLQEIIKKPQC